MAKFFVRFEETHTNCPNQLAKGLRDYMKEHDGKLLHCEITLKKVNDQIKSEIDMIHSKHARCKQIHFQHSADSKSMQELLGDTSKITAYHVGSLYFHKVKNEVGMLYPI